eukprot:COSAG01_NODE_6318_length_3739_cov_2.484341_2_plen_118_part_00
MSSDVHRICLRLLCLSQDFVDGLSHFACQDPGQAAKCDETASRSHSTIDPSAYEDQQKIVDMSASSTNSFLEPQSAPSESTPGGQYKSCLQVILCVCNYKIQSYVNMYPFCRLRHCR